MIVSHRSSDIFFSLFWHSTLGLSGCFAQWPYFLHRESKAGAKSESQFVWWAKNIALILFFFEVVKCMRIVVLFQTRPTSFAFNTLLQAPLNWFCFWWINIALWFCFDGGTPNNAMILERDQHSDGWVAHEGHWNSGLQHFERMRACFRSTDPNALTNDTYNGWSVNRAADGAPPDWGDTLMTCLSRWEADPWTCSYWL